MPNNDNSTDMILQNINTSASNESAYYTGYWYNTGFEVRL